MSRFRAKAHLVFHCCLCKKSPFAVDVCYLPYSTPFLINSFPLLSSALPIKTGEPSKYELETLSQKLGNKWEKLARRLGFDPDGQIDAFKEDNKGLANTAFSMLRAWKQREGKDATYTELYHALCHSLVGCKLLAEEFCCDKNAGNGSL